MRVELSDAGRSSTVSTDEFMRYAIANVPGVSRSDFLETMIEKVNAWAKQNGKGVRAKVAVKGMDFSRPGQPERFEETSTKPIGQMVLNKIEAALAAGKTVYLSNMMKSIVITPKNYANWKASGTPLFKVDSKGDLRIYQGGKYVVMTSGGLSHVRVDAHSRPGQPERFDASSLDRKGFAEASSSPMLGKLLSEKQMPEGGWRAVETGGGALVISFEDGDVAGNFARRVASNGYSATAPVQSIGRYWNVEVKNG